jgi:hypothetical protein
LFVDIKRRLERWVDRVLPGELSLSEMAIVRAVHTRSLPWGHYAVQITNNQMLHGMREHYNPGGLGPYLLDENNMPVWTGTGLDPRTEREARKSVHRKGLITTFDIPRVGRRPTRAYMLSTPMALFSMAQQDLDPNDRGDDDGLLEIFHTLLCDCDPPPGGRWYQPRERYYDPARINFGDGGQG